MISTKKMAGKGQQTLMNTQHGVTVWTVAVTNLLALQVVLSPFALATSITPPSAVPNSTVLADTLLPSTEGMDSVSETTTEGIMETRSPAVDFLTNNSATTQSAASHTTESVERNSTFINTTQRTPDNTSVPSFEGVTLTDVEQSNFTTVETIATSANDTEPHGSTHPPTSLPTTGSFANVTDEQEMATATNQTVEVTSLITTILYTLSFTDPTPAPPTQHITSSPHPDATTATPSVPNDNHTATPTLTPPVTNSQTVPSQTPDVTSYSVPTTRIGTPFPSTQTVADTTQPTTVVVAETTDAGVGGSTTLTVQQWVGIGIGIVLVVILSVVAIILLVWIRSRNSLPSKKPSITVSREEYARSSTLALKDPTWRQSLNMALQSMNTHIELPKETGEEMQAVDNAAYAEESHDPQTSNQDESHLTKV